MVVLRAAGERTLPVCQKILSQHISKKYIHAIQERPFENALRRSFQIGIESGKQWLVTLDADVLLFPNALKDLVDAASQMPEDYVEVGARIFDKVLGTFRLAGNRVYRVSILPKALSCIPEIGAEIRPEAATLRKLAGCGHPHRRIGLVTGIHDFEQYYGDLYRKAFVHGQKHDYLAGDLLKRCLKKKEADPDFAVILRGFCDGMASAEKATIDSGRFRDAASGALLELGLDEKPPMDLADFQNLDHWILSQLEFEPTAFQDHDLPALPKIMPTARERFREIAGKHGILAAMSYAAGSGLVKLGRKLKQL